MNKKEFEAVLKVSAEIRYEYFIKKIVDYEEIWGLYDNGWVTTIDENKRVLIPLWPKKEFAEYCARNEWKETTAKSIDLYEFIEEWIPEMKKDKQSTSIFWNNKDSVYRTADNLINDIMLELENY
ncbi:DUF2750 domain-containing protein [Clostridium novyi]|uniref:DUF2750 domain-containing protein n=1 Tax=Clostridium novyi TaxID=1542 RepID=UPI0004D6573D|nr:DUF2750 domain-containing protein [Clostridium novyi]KEH85352.1 hypothetical protein Z967_08875 [Clostridium novyi A str. 4540]KEH91180.1 hypothetical protein Z964_10055 [Clostridium novyi A str. GD211209]